MNAMTYPRPRGLIGTPRADATPTQILNELRNAFEAFKAEQVQEVNNLKAGFDDVVTKDKIDRINSDVGSLNKALEDVNSMIAGLRVGGADGVASPDAKAHAAAFNQYFRRGVDNGLRDLEVKASLTTQSDPDGGYLVPVEMSTTIDRVVGQMSVLRQLATVMPINGNEYKKLVNVGGAGGGWVGEEQARPETATPGLRELVFTMMELYANPATTQRMLDTGIVDVAAWLADEVQIVFAEKEGEAFVAGTGVKQPRGYTTYDKVANASWEWGKIGYVATGKADGFIVPTTSVSPEDVFIDALYALKEAYRANATWVMSDATMGGVRKLKDVEGRNLWQPPSAASEVATILQKPVRTDDFMPAVGAGNFPIAIADWKRAYMIVDGPGVRVLRDPFSNKPYVHFYTTKNVGGGLSNYQAIKLVKVATS